MSFISRIRRHSCVYWGKPINNGLEVRFPLPVDCKCRWDGGGEIEETKKGTESVSSATVLVDRITEQGGFLWYGTLDSLKEKYGTAIDNPKNMPDAKEIKRTETIAMIRTKDMTNMKKVAHFAYL